VVFGSLSTVARFPTAETEALSRYNTVRSYAIETSIYLPGGRKSVQPTSYEPTSHISH